MTWKDERPLREEIDDGKKCEEKRGRHGWGEDEILTGGDRCGAEGK